MTGTTTPGIIARAHKSKVARWRAADVFIWYRERDYGDEVVACFNSTVTGPLTVKTLIRWFTMLKPWDVEMGFTPVKLECPKYLRYTFTPSAEVPLENSAVLEGGDYAFHPIHEGVGAAGAKPPFVNRSYVPSHAGAFRQTTRNLTADALQAHSAEWIPPASAREEVMRRYQNGCPFTGSAWDHEHVDARWIYPPPLRGQMCGPLARQWDDEDEPPEMEVIVNIIPMHADVHELWMKNMLSVDVEDGNRIVAFHPSVRKRINLSAALTACPDAGRDIFLREHFQYSLIIQLTGGNVTEDFRLIDVHNFIENVKIGQDGQPMDLEEAKWKTLIGAVVREEIQARPRPPTKADSDDDGYDELDEIDEHSEDD